MLHRLVAAALAGSAFALAVPTIASAQQYPTPESEATQQQLDHLHDHLEHDRQHQQIEDAHAREHESGFTSEAQHQAYHQQLDAIHGQVHDGLPGTEHSHGYNGYAGSQGYQGYGHYQDDRGYGPQRTYRRTVVTRYVTRPAYRVHHRRHVVTYYR